MSQDHELQPDNLSIPDYVASRGARLEGILGRVSDAPLRDGNRLALLKNGPDTYDDWLAAIARAERWIHLDNYIFQDDEIGNRFAEALSAKAKGGRARAGTPRLVRLPGRAPLLLEGYAGGRRCRSRRSTRPRRDRRWVLFGATTASCSSWTASTPRRAACASPTAGWSAPRRRGFPTGTPPSA